MSGGNQPKKNLADLLIPGFVILSMGGDGGWNQQKHLLQTDKRRMKTKNRAYSGSKCRRSHLELQLQIGN